MLDYAATTFWLQRDGSSSSKIVTPVRSYGEVLKKEEENKK